MKIVVKTKYHSRPKMNKVWVNAWEKIQREVKAFPFLRGGGAFSIQPFTARGSVQCRGVGGK